ARHRWDDRRSRPADGRDRRLLRLRQRLLQPCRIRRLDLLLGRHRDPVRPRREPLVPAQPVGGDLRCRRPARACPPALEAAGGWDRVVFVILMLSTLAFDGILSTPAWQDFNLALEPVWLPLGAWGFFFARTLGLLLLTVAFLLVFVAFMEAVIYLGQRKVDMVATVSAFALTLVPIALVYNAAHNYSYVVVSSQYLIPLLNDPLGKGWHLWPAVVGFKPSFALAQASTVWYAQIVLIVLGHVTAVYLSHLRAGERFRTVQRALLSQYPMLLLMIMYTMTSLWILAQPITRETG